jgi:hypothetical protein
MTETLTDQEMRDLRKHNLYHVSGDDIAFPNFKYCKPDAPYYEHVGDSWVMIELPAGFVSPMAGAAQ